MRLLLLIALSVVAAEAKTKMILTSAAFKVNEKIPKLHTCDGEDVSPALSWTGVPEKAKSLALIVDDPDAPAGTWVHWVVYDIPAAKSSLPQGLPKSETLPDGAKQGASWGVESFGRVGWSGPCPPKGKPHRYVFVLYALSEPTGLEPKATKAELLKAMSGKVLKKAELVGLYGR
jgi:Raf kinase inhibitor-like YbhB/YbcL family protein